ncbi:MAG TPA: TetR family transcriptional regulator [Bdellovibrionota bacterium]|jgi:AcrR family transcriptional regulator|nr:TetR family transcriptional regulator [Bdellovibrionota bacterium]
MVAAPKSPAVESTRSALIEAAKTLFAARGLDGVSVKEIADEAQVNVSLVSYHFGGKEGLYKAVLDQQGQVKLEAAERILKSASTPEEFALRLRMFADEMISGWAQDPCVMTILQRDVELNISATIEVFKERFLRVFDTVHAFLASSAKAGLLRKDVDPETATGLLFGMVAHSTRMDPLVQKFFKKTLKDSHYRDHVVNQIVGLFTRGVLKE